MSICILLDSKTSHTGFLLLVPGWQPNSVRSSAGNRGRLPPLCWELPTAKLTNLFCVCPLLADTRIAGLSPGSLQEHLQWCKAQAPYLALLLFLFRG